MKVKCEYCNTMFEDSLEKCPNCGAANKNIRRMADKTPKTIKELHEWYAARNLPPYEVTRFFIGVDYKKPKAYGIYQDGADFVVYKNKADGSRAVRYKGSDEAYAVNEIYLKLKSEIVNQKARNVERGNTRGINRGGNNNGLSKNSFFKMLGNFFKGFFGLLAFSGIALCWYSFIPIAVVFGIFLLLYLKKRDIYNKIKFLMWPAAIVALFISLGIAGDYSTPSYYNYDGNVICNYANDYYAYDSGTGDYYPIDNDYLPDGFTENSSDYETSWDDSFTMFESSDYYDENFETRDSSSSSYYDSDWDSDYDWDSSSDWDSGSSDWGSDW